MGLGGIPQEWQLWLHSSQRACKNTHTTQHTLSFLVLPSLRVQERRGSPGEVGWEWNCPGELTEAVSYNAAALCVGMGEVAMDVFH